MRVSRVFLGFLVLLLPFMARAETLLLMAEQDGCHWCERWNADIAETYPKTPEGAAAPLQRYDITEGVPAGVSLKSSAHFTPTFILIEDGQELGRIEGYPGEDFFWGLLGLMLKDAGKLEG